MPPRQMSRHMFTTARTDADGRSMLSERDPYRYRDLPDNTLHEVQEGETLFSIAGQHFEGFPRPAGLWWVLMDFQPQPIHDPTIKLVPGSTLVLPSKRTVQEEILNEKRRREVVL